MTEYEGKRLFPDRINFQVYKCKNIPHNVLPIKSIFEVLSTLKLITKEIIISVIDLCTGI